ncbi:hypothetical protein [Paraflavitalea sp. CAU 1676]|uniref:hypothetical protein n=1 Tax=Paraflavitalea sp. CAU 1676 TaxID=3032598 RepID=UPI0023DC5C7D|nr:hypothetical protein [Paraflavitalea sp. CAU 1676]MDF2192484.1 hypothetical protein [Paraflavitalea sp. CAU 1676]
MRKKRGPSDGLAIPPTHFLDLQLVLMIFLILTQFVTMIINDRYATVTNRPVYLASREYIRENGYLLAAILIVLFVECLVWRYLKYTQRIQWFFWGYYLPLLIILVVLPALALCRGTYYCFLQKEHIVWFFAAIGLSHISFIAALNEAYVNKYPGATGHDLGILEGIFDLFT